MLFRYKYTRSYRDRHGKVRIEYRRNGKTKRLRGTPGTSAFQAAYDAVHASHEAASPDPAPARPVEGTWRWLCIEYCKSSEFSDLNASTQRVRKLILESICCEPWTRGSARTFGDAPIRAMSPQALMV